MLFQYGMRLESHEHDVVAHEFEGISRLGLPDVVGLQQCLDLSATLLSIMGQSASSAASADAVIAMAKQRIPFMPPLGPPNPVRAIVVACW